MMLSRLQPVLKNGNFGGRLFKIPFAAAATSTPAVAAGQGSSTIVEGPERDLVNFPRPKRAVYGGKVRMGFLPEEWFQFFYKKTGVTGPYLFGTGLITYLVSKEIYVIEHEFWNAVSLFIILGYGIKKFGPKVAEYADKQNEEQAYNLNKGKSDAIEALNNVIEAEKKSQWSALGQNLLFEAKRENIALQLEAEYRQRMSMAYNAIKKRLDYQVSTITAQRQAEHKHMAKWIADQVIKSITPQQEAEAMKKCLADLKALSAAA